MATTAEKARATSARLRDGRQQRAAASRQHGGQAPAQAAPPADAALTEPGESVLVVGYVTPDKGERDRPDKASPQRADRLARVVVQLEGERLELTTDQERTASLVASVYQLLDRSGLWTISEQLRILAATPARTGSAQLPFTRARITGMGTVQALRARSDAAAVADLWEGECHSLDRIISGWLIQVEDRATSIVLGRLRASRAAVLSERDRYLTGLAPATVLDRQLPLWPGRLSAEAAKLRTFLYDVAKLRIAARDALVRYQKMAEPHADRPSLETLEQARRTVLEQIAVVHRKVAEAARSSPLLYWIVDWDADPVIDLDRRGGNDQVLYHRIATILRRCWQASWTVQDRLPTGPARSTAGGEEDTPEERVGKTIPDEDEAGPWRFPRILQQALDDLGWSAPSPQAVAVERVLAAAGNTWNQSSAFAAGSFAVTVALHFLLPPAAVYADLVIGAVDLLATMAQLAERRTEYLAVFDQRQALIDAPQGQEVAAALVGLFTAPMPGAAGLLANLLPFAIQVWTPAPAEGRL